MSAHVFALVNQKGGIGKTTAAIHIGVGLKNRGYKTLIIDMDAQCNLTFSLNGDYQHKPTIMDAILDRVSVFDCIQHLDEVDVIPGSSNLSALDSQLDPEGREYFLDETIEPLRSVYDYIVIDSPPALSLITVGIMCAANSLIIPVGMDMYSLQGTGQLYRTYSAVKQYCNENLVIDGILVNQNAISLKKLLKEIAENMHVRIFDSTISTGVAVKHAVIAQQSIYKNAPDSRAAQEFNALVDEILEIQKRKKEHPDVNIEEIAIEKLDLPKPSEESNTSDNLEDALNELGVIMDEPKYEFNYSNDISSNNLRKGEDE